MKPNRNIKDSVFSLYFTESTQRLVEVYNAVQGTDYPLDTYVEINTLKDVLYKDRINDISFIIDNNYKNPDLQTVGEHGIIYKNERHIKPCQRWRKRTEVNPEEQRRGMNQRIQHQYRGLSKCIIKRDTKNDINRLMKLARQR